MSDWPPAVIGTNFATDCERTVILLHQFEGRLEVYRGDVLARRLTGEFYVEDRPERLTAREHDRVTTVAEPAASATIVCLPEREAA